MGCCVAGFAVEPILAAAHLIRTLVLLGLPLLVLYPRVPVVVMLGHSPSQQPVRHHPASDAECVRTPNG